MKKKRLTIVMLCSLILSLLLLVGCSLDSVQSPTTPNAQVDTVQVYYLDVGQGDSQLLYMPDGTTVLIDSGERTHIDTIVPALKSYGVKDIDILIATHPHSDHIGCMATVVRSFPIGEIYMPRTAKDDTPTTVAYEKLLEAIDKKGLRIKQGNAGVVPYNKDGAKLEFLSPTQSDYSNLNNYSIVSKLTYGQTSFLFMGDAEKQVLNNLLQEGVNLRSTVLKAGHHGSSNAISKKFLEAVQPEYAIISCGKNNDYGHPHKETMQLLNQFHVKIYRTDQDGTILATSNGKTVSFQTDLPSVDEAA